MAVAGTLAGIPLGCVLAYAVLLPLLQLLGRAAALLGRAAAWLCVRAAQAAASATGRRRAGGGGGGGSVGGGSGALRQGPGGVEAGAAGGAAPYQHVAMAMAVWPLALDSLRMPMAMMPPGGASAPAGVPAWARAGWEQNALAQA